MDSGPGLQVLLLPISRAHINIQKIKEEKKNQTKKGNIKKLKKVEKIKR